MRIGSRFHCLKDMRQRTHRIALTLKCCNLKSAGLALACAPTQSELMKMEEAGKKCHLLLGIHLQDAVPAPFGPGRAGVQIPPGEEEGVFAESCRDRQHQCTQCDSLEKQGTCKTDKSLRPEASCLNLWR